MSFLRFIRHRPPVGRLDILTASVGALAAIFLTGFVTSLWLGGESSVLPYLIAPMGASAVLLFAVPASPLAQPWSVVSGNVVSALVGSASVMLIGDPLIAAACAVAVAIAAMRLLRCLHPPGGAVALTAVIGGPAVIEAGFSFALVPVALNCVLMLATAWAFNNLAGRPYPHRAKPVPANTHSTRDAPAPDRVGFTATDIDQVLARYNELLDVSREDLNALFREVEAQAHRRLHGEIRCADIMSRDVISARADEGVGQARDRLLAQNLAFMPVLDEEGAVVGLVGHSQLLAGAGRTVAEVMDAFPLTISPEQPIDQLLPELSSGRKHEAVVVHDDRRLAGVITQTDLLAALWRSHVVEQVASAQPL